MNVEKNLGLLSTGTNRLLLFRFGLFLFWNCVVWNKVKFVFIANGKWWTWECHIQCSTIMNGLIQFLNHKNLHTNTRIAVVFVADRAFWAFSFSSNNKEKTYGSHCNNSRLHWINRNSHICVLISLDQSIEKAMKTVKNK